jgi:hypothetical protein
MTLLARIEADLALCERAPHWTCPDDWADCNAARTLLPAYARALKVAVEGLEDNACRRPHYGPDCCVLHGTLRAIERELTGGTE